MARSTRNQPFCWQEKKILMLFRKLFTGNELSKFRNLYGAITEMDSDFNNQDIKFYTKTISTYSGLSEDWIPKGLKKLQELKIIEIVEDRINGKFKGKRLIFTPENIDESIDDTVPVKSTNGKITNGFLESSEDSSLLEDSIYQEEINIVKRSSQKNDTCSNYKNKTEYIEDVRKYVEFDTDIENILDYFYDCYLEKNNNYNHYRIDYETFQESINSLNNIYDFIDNNYQLKGKTTFGIMLEYVENYFNTKEKHSIKNFADEQTFMMFLTTVYKKNTDCEMFFLAGKGKGRRLKDSLSDVI
jgi:hypothetical protein